jgi:uncharacterized membrane protein YoaK (UPF0700 family)
MLVRYGEQRDSSSDRRLACSLAAVAGALNTAAFHAVGFFSANMTGNVSSLSDRIALGNLTTGAFFLGIVVIFIVGSTVSTLLINAGRRREHDGIYAYSILTEAILLGLLGWLDPRLSATGRGPVMILGLSFLMGLQNAVVTRISEARVRTTHVSGMSTDIGIDLGMLIDVARGREPRAEAPRMLARLRLHSQTVLSFLAGGVIGVLVYRRVGSQLLLGAAAVLFVIAMTGVLRVHLAARAGNEAG